MIRVPEPVVHGLWPPGSRVVVIGRREWMPTKERRRLRNVRGKQADRTAAENQAMANQWFTGRQGPPTFYGLAITGFFPTEYPDEWTEP